MALSPFFVPGSIPLCSQCSSITIVLHQLSYICFYLEASGDSYTEEIRVRSYGCSCSPRKGKEEAEECCRCREITVLAA